jgi:hypothetical protein
MTARAKFWWSFVFLAVVSVVMLLVSGLSLTDIRHIGTPRNALLIDGMSIKIPFPPASDGRVLTEVPVTTSGTHEFMFKDEYEVPVRWDPCRSVSYVINPDGGPQGGDELIAEAVGRVSSATGLAFTYEGYTSEVPSFDRRLIQEDVYGDRFVPLIFGWSSGATNPDLADTVTGLGGPNSVPGAFGEQRYLEGGVVLLDGPDMQAILTSPAGSPLAVAVIMHETGHVMGLAHVDDPTELMNATNTSLIDWGPGDLEGLAIAGSGPCEDL